MPAKSDAYSTLVGSTFETKKIQAPLEYAVVNEDLDETKEGTLGLPVYNGVHPLFITGTYPSESRVPSFPHPILVRGIRGKTFVCSDLRLILRENKGEGFQARVKNQQELDFMLNRHRLCTLWVAGRTSDFRSHLRFGAFAYGVWLSNSIGHLKGLDVFQKTVVQIVFMSFYYDLTQNDGDKGHAGYREDLIPWIDGQMHWINKDLKDIVTKIGDSPMENIDDALTRMKEVVNTPLLDSINPGTLLNSIKSHWFGQGVEAQKLVGVALEDPPTWVSLCLAALTYSGYKNSMIAQTVSKLGKKGESEEFIKSAANIMSDSLRMESTTDVYFPLSKDGDTTDYDPAQLVMRAENLTRF